VEPQSDQQLREKLLDYLGNYQRQELEQMKARGVLEEYIKLVIEATKSYAENLVLCGESVEQAWNQAIRLERLRSETD
jgi:hypothetical protein